MRRMTDKRETDLLAYILSGFVIAISGIAVGVASTKYIGRGHQHFLCGVRARLFGGRAGCKRRAERGSRGSHHRAPRAIAAPSPAQSRIPPTRDPVIS